MMDIVFKRCSSEYILDLLKEMSPQFTPALSDSLDLCAYAGKLSKHATFLICSRNKKIAGCIVFYPNYISSILYIPLVWVNNEFRGSGIARRLFEHLMEFGTNEGFSSIDLEVLKDNVIAYNLYSSIGFHIIEDRGQKKLLRLPLIIDNQSLNYGRD